MEFDKDGNPITPNNDSDDSKNPNGNPSGENWNSDWEKRFKDTQASFTKANQERIDMAKLLVDSDPINITKISDEKIRNKIISEKYGVDNLEELKLFHPEVLRPKKDKDDEEDELTEVERLRKEVNLMKYKDRKTKTKEVLETVISANKDIVATIPDFEDKINEELKYISDELSPKDRVTKAFKLVAGSDSSQADAYSILQGITTNKAKKSDTYEEDLKREQNDLRKMLGLKKK